MNLWLLLLTFSILFVILGHIFKVKRWALLIKVYEKPSFSNLLNAMTFGHTINALLPFRVGDIVRFYWAGRKCRNGYSLALATVLADLYVDAVTVGAIFFLLAQIGKGSYRLQEVARFYMFSFLVIIPTSLFLYLLRRKLKHIISYIASIFNENIEFRILYVSYLCLASIKDICKNVNKLEFIGYSIGIWLCYSVSYVFFADAVQNNGFKYTASDVFTKLFSGSSLYHIETSLLALWASYLLVPLASCWLLSVFGKKTGDNGNEYISVLPQMNQTDRLSFLRTYYEDEEREHINSYLKINRDVTVIQDNSAGSNASTLLVMKKDGNMFFRKYAFDKDGEKLQEQIDWIEDHQGYIPLPLVSEKHNGGNYVTYDMPCYNSVVSMFKYIHTMPTDDSWKIIETAMNDISQCLHNVNVRLADEEAIAKYIDNKVFKNLKIIKENSKYIRNLEQYDKVYVNGKELDTLSFYDNIFDRQHLLEIFRKDSYSDIHGDLTIENIVCLTGRINLDSYSDKKKPLSYYFIDPNTGNIHDSPFLDYSKLLQSLHGNYEFLMMVNRVEIDGDKVSYLTTKSEAYSRIYALYREYIYGHFTYGQVVSIYYHEVVHWLRLMPYKIKKDEKLAVVFYTALLEVLKDVWELEHEHKK